MPTNAFRTKLPPREERPPPPPLHLTAAGGHVARLAAAGWHAVEIAPTVGLSAAEVRAVLAALASCTHP